MHKIVLSISIHLHFGEELKLSDGTYAFHAEGPTFNSWHLQGRLFEILGTAASQYRKY